MLKICGAFVVAALTCLVAIEVEAAEHKLTGHNTKIEFVGSKADGKHTGSFPKLTGLFEVHEEMHKSKITVTIDVEALESDDPKLTGHLKSPDFFETKKYPDAKFVSTSIKPEKEGYRITGELMMHGKKKEISFPATIERKDGGVALQSEFRINRSEWGISYGAGKIDEAVLLIVNINAK